MAWTAVDGTPRVVPIWFHWTGSHLVMTTFAGALKLNAIVDGTVLAIAIDSESFPYRSLKVRGPVSVEPVDGLADEYRLAAARYLGADAGAAWCDALAGRSQVALRMAPSWAVESDLSGIAFMSSGSASPD